VEDAITRARSRIVQSPERIKKTISIMSTTAMEDKKIVATNEAKSRDLQAKINALHHIETVSLYTCLFSGLECLMTLEGCERLYRADSNN